jgi:hypothetical protein
MGGPCRLQQAADDIGLGPMIETQLTEEVAELVDPDPFTTGLGIYAAIAGGGAFLEGRRLREIVQTQQRGEFRAAWFAARRTLIHFKQQVDEFETYMLEDNYGQKQFRIGAVRLVVDVGRKRSMRRLRGQTLTTASHMGDDLDDLSEFLGPEYSDRIEEVLSHLQAIEIPETYRGLIRVARDAFDEYESFLTFIADKEGFELHEQGD